MKKIIPFALLPDEALVRLPVVLALSGWGKTSIYGGMRKGTFPQSVCLGKRARGWRVGDLRAFLKNLGEQSAGGAS